MTTNDPTAKPVAPRQLGRYQILSELGRGAMGVVYKAEDPSLTRMVAIKTINLARQRDDRAEYEARFFREAKADGAFNHPNVIIIYDVGRERDLAYIAMELLEGSVFFSSRRRHTILVSDWSSDVCSSDLVCRLLLEKKEEHTSELQSLTNLICSFLLEKTEEKIY